MSPSMTISFVLIRTPMNSMGSFTGISEPCAGSMGRGSSISSGGTRVVRKPFRAFSSPSKTPRSVRPSRIHSPTSSGMSNTTRMKSSMGPNRNLKTSFAHPGNPASSTSIALSIRFSTRSPTVSAMSIMSISKGNVGTITICHLFGRPGLVA